MIITCINCSKNFNVDSTLIPEKGRLLQCNACNNEWFFKKENTNETNLKKEFDKSNKDDDSFETESPNKKTEFTEDESPETIKLLDKSIKNDFLINKVSPKEIKKINKDGSLKKDLIKDIKNYNILGKMIVFIISFIALIIIIDTFKSPIGKIVPNIEFLLYNLYETIKDFILFFNDLI